MTLNVVNILQSINEYYEKITKKWPQDGPLSCHELSYSSAMSLLLALYLNLWRAGNASKLVIQTHTSNKPCSN